MPPNSPQARRTEIGGKRIISPPMARQTDVLGRSGSGIKPEPNIHFVLTASTNWLAYAADAIGHGHPDTTFEG